VSSSDEPDISSRKRVVVMAHPSSSCLGYRRGQVETSTDSEQSDGPRARGSPSKAQQRVWRDEEWRSGKTKANGVSAGPR